MHVLHPPAVCSGRSSEAEQASDGGGHAWPSDRAEQAGAPADAQLPHPGPRRGQHASLAAPSSSDTPMQVGSHVWCETWQHLQLVCGLQGDWGTACAALCLWFASLAVAHRRTADGVTHVDV